MGLFNLLRKRKKASRASEEGVLPDEYEYCPRCDANLTLQKGYKNDLPYWLCRGCGEMLINPSVNAEDDIAWFCDRCGALLNEQASFSNRVGKWTCSECGFVNEISPREVYASEDEFQADLRNPYRGLSDEAALALSEYEELDCIDDRTDILRIRHRENGKICIKKHLVVYNRGIYEFLKDNPVVRMPEIYEVYEGKNCLIVIEEYIEGRTLAEILGENQVSQDEAVRITLSLCRILRSLHNLPTPIIHRDIKPSNIMITAKGDVYLLDVNVAKWYDTEKTDDTRYLGTREYAAPEQIGYGLHASSPKSDVYALGILMNVMLTGNFPKEERATGRIWEIIQRCIQLDAEKRISVEELLHALQTLREETFDEKNDSGYKGCNRTVSQTNG